MRRSILPAALLAPLLLLAPVAGAEPDAHWRGDNPWLAKEMTRADLLPAVEKAADYFVRNLQADGQFDFIKDPLGRCCGEKKERYSLVRHLGGVYALLRAYEITPDKRWLDAAKSGIDFVLRFREPHAGVRVVRGVRGNLDLGENGFLLIDTALYDRLSGTRTYADASKDLAAFLKKGLVYGGPYATDGQWAESQAIIGLTLFHQHVAPDPQIPQLTARWLAASMADGKFSHWSIQAIRWVRDINPALDQRLAAYGVDAARKLLKDVVTRDGGKGDGDGTLAAETPRQIGSRRRKFGSCGVTARNEGLIAGYQLARAIGREDEASYLLARIKEHLAHAMQFQYGMPGNLYESDAPMARVGRLFALDGGVFDHPKRGHVRVDYVSHHMRAIAAYLELPNVPKAAGLEMQDLAH